MHFYKIPHKVINYRDYTVIEEQIDYRKSPDRFFEIIQSVLNKHAPRKKNYIHGNNKLFMNKPYSKAIMQKHISERNS